MSGRLLVDHAAMLDAVARIERAVLTTEARLDQLRADLAPLESEWFGSAQDAWQIAQQRWSAAEVEMRQILAGLGARVRAAQEAYAEADRAGARAFG